MNESAGIAHHEGSLFITSGTALHEYADNGRWIRQMYEDTSQLRTVWKCVVSPAGDKVYISQPSLHKLITLDMNGTILATFYDPGLLRPWGVCVAPKGQIIVCGDASDTVLLVDSDGKKKLATLATFSNGLRWPWSVYYTKHTDTILVGQWYDTIVVLKIKTEPGALIAPKIESPTDALIAPKIESPTDALIAPKIESPTDALIAPKIQSPTDALIAPKIESPTDALIAPKIQSPTDALIVPKIESPIDALIAPKIESPTDALIDPKIESPTDALIDPKIESPTDPLIAPKIESPTDALIAPKIESPTDALIAPKIQSPTDALIAPKIESPTDALIAPKIESPTDALIAPKIESPMTRDIKGLYEILQIDVMVECRSDLFPLFKRGCGALQGIVTRGKSILERPVFSEKESQMVSTRSVYVYTTSALMEDLKADCQEHLSPVKDFNLQELRIIFPALLIVTKDQHDKIKKSFSSINEDITSLGVLFVDKEQNTKDISQQDTTDSSEKVTKDISEKDTNDLFKKLGVLQSVAAQSHIMVTADHLLERAIFAVLKNLMEKCLNTYGSPKDMPDSEKKKTWQSIYTYARTAYKRCKVPTFERLTLPEITYKYPENIDNVLRSVLKIKGVLGCSKDIGYLEVLIDNEQDIDETTRRIQELLENTDVKCKMSYGKFRKFLSSGEGVFNGTMGGFAQKFADPENSNLVALISRHVAMANIQDSTVFLNVDNMIMGGRQIIPEEPEVDIFPIDVYTGFLQQCNTRFRTEDGMQLLHGKLLQLEDVENWIGEPVYIWGAQTSPGLGTLAEINMDVPNGFGIKIHDRNYGHSFCIDGDSGAMVCATDSSDGTETLYAIAMVVGKFILQDPHQPEIYNACLLSEAFKQFENSYGSAFELCSDDA
ncbi:uncharacterized protein LOC127863506 [Dreissena polymorpha]|nr:uncharacterized protein LOC127863506 [Dreissena polymorpha]